MNKEHTFKGTALVTGGAKRIGSHICQQLAAQGYRIAIHYNSSESEAKTLAQQIKEQGGVADTVQCNLLDIEQTQSLIDNVSQKLPDLNLLVNNASIFEPSKFQETSLEDLEQNLLIHLKTPYILAQKFSQQCSKGQIINILDTHVTDTKTNYFNYLLSKQALTSLTKLLAVELAPGIRVNGIAPGLILPPEDQDSSYLDRLAKDIPLKTKGSPDDIALSIEFLVRNAFVTGQILFNDGGEHLL